MHLGMEFECAGFLKGPSICVGPFPLSLIYGVGTFVLFITIIRGIKVSRVPIWECLFLIQTILRLI